MLRIFSVFSSPPTQPSSSSSSPNPAASSAAVAAEVMPSSPLITTDSAAAIINKNMQSPQNQQQVQMPSFEIPPPFDASTLWMLGRRQHWETLVDLLRPVASNKFGVCDRAAKNWLDSVVRARFDAAKDPDTGMGVVYEMVSLFGGDDADVLRTVLACGVHPDIAKKHSWRPLHICGSYARAEAARVILLCRPDLAARNHHGHTPLMVARGEKYPEDDRYPDRIQQRPKVAALIEYHAERGFVKLAELACKREWFAVKNLVRRQVVPKSELTKDKYEGKTAHQWAEFHGEVEVAKEICFYTKLCLAEHTPGARLKRRLKNLRMWQKKVSPPCSSSSTTTPDGGKNNRNNGDLAAVVGNGHHDSSPLSTDKLISSPSTTFNNNGTIVANGHTNGQLQTSPHEFPCAKALTNGHAMIKVHSVTSV